MPSPILDRVRDLTPSIAGRAAEFERAREVPDDVIADLVAAGCFRMLVPRRYAGEEMALVDSLKVIEELSEADASTGWLVMISCSNVLVLGLLPTVTFQAIYAGGPDVITGGSHAPKGKAAPVTDGYLVSGQWPFASGCRHSEWLVVNARVSSDGDPRSAGNGMPASRLAFLPAGKVEVIDTWHALGLRGTGSSDIRVEESFCPSDWSCQLWSDEPADRTTPVFALPPVAPLALFIAAVAVGAAQGAVNDLIALIGGGKRPAYGSRRVAESPLFQAALGEADARLQAARALVYEQARFAWKRALAGGGYTLLDRARMRTASSHAVATAAQVGESAHRLAGSHPVYDGSSLQRRLRDLLTITQHAGVGTDFYPLAGALLVGESVDSSRI